MPDDASVIDFLRVQFAQVNKRLDGIDLKLSEVIQRIGALEIGQASLRRDNAALNEMAIIVAHLRVRLDHDVSERLDQIEHHLDPTDAPAVR